MIVVVLWRVQERNMIAWVVSKGRDQKKANPQPTCCNMTSTDYNSSENAAQVDDQMFHRMRVEGNYGDARSPFVVDLVYMFIKPFVV